MNSWCEGCARKNQCYTADIRPKCFVPITSNDCTIERKTEQTGSSLSSVKDKLRMLEGGADVHEFCKRCSESKARMINGERYIVCKKASNMVCISMKECPLGRWVCKYTYIISPQV